MTLPGPHVELTDAENERFLGTLTHRAWHLLNGRVQRSKFFAPEYYDLDQLHCKDHRATPCPQECPNAMQLVRDLLSLSPGLFHDALQTSGSIKGQHRSDIKDAIIGAPRVYTGHSVVDPDRQGQREKPRERGL